MTMAGQTHETGYEHLSSVRSGVPVGSVTTIVVICISPRRANGGADRRRIHRWHDGWPTKMTALRFTISAWAHGIRHSAPATTRTCYADSQEHYAAAAAPYILVTCRAMPPVPSTMGCRPTCSKGETTYRIAKTRCSFSSLRPSMTLGHKGNM